MKIEFRLTMILLLATIMLAIGTYLRVWNLHFSIGIFFVHHWIAIISGGYLIIATFIYAILKRYSEIRKTALLLVHIFGNLAASLFIALHFAHHLGRPAEFAADLGTGLAAFLLLTITLVAGIILHFRIEPEKRETWHSIHAGFALSSFIVIIIHALKNFGLL